MAKGVYDLRSPQARNERRIIRSFWTLLYKNCVNSGNVQFQPLTFVIKFGRKFLRDRLELLQHKNRRKSLIIVTFVGKVLQKNVYNFTVTLLVT